MLGIALALPHAQAQGVAVARVQALAQAVALAEAALAEEARAVLQQRPTLLCHYKLVSF